MYNTASYAYVLLQPTGTKPTPHSKCVQIEQANNTRQNTTMAAHVEGRDPLNPLVERLEGPVLVITVSLNNPTPTTPRRTLTILIDSLFVRQIKVSEVESSPVANQALNSECKAHEYEVLGDCHITILR